MADTPKEVMANLSPEGKKRVEAALKDAIEREVIAEGAGGPLAAGNIFSRGWIFSRLTPTQEQELIRVLPELSRMNAQEFVNFADRLAQLKAKTGPQRKQSE